MCAFQKCTLHIVGRDASSPSAPTHSNNKFTRCAHSKMHPAHRRPRRTVAECSNALRVLQRTQIINYNRCAHSKCTLRIVDRDTSSLSAPMHSNKDFARCAHLQMYSAHRRPRRIVVESAPTHFNKKSRPMYVC